MNAFPHPTIFVRVRITLALLTTVIIIFISFSIHSSLPYILMSSTGITETPPFIIARLPTALMPTPLLGFSYPDVELHRSIKAWGRDAYP